MLLERQCVIVVRLSVSYVDMCVSQKTDKQSFQNYKNRLFNSFWNLANFNTTLKNVGSYGRVLDSFYLSFGIDKVGITAF